MIIILSPSKSLSLNNLNSASSYSTPHFNSEAEKLMTELRSWTEEELGASMKLSDTLSMTVKDWHDSWLTNKNHVLAGFAMKGEAFKALDLESLSVDTIEHSNERLFILSGLYGALRPCDAINPYRLEMAQAFKTYDGTKSLNSFWSDRLVKFFNSQTVSTGSNILINLASDEYSKVVLKKGLNARVINFSFRVETEKGLKNVSVFAKQARGAMARYILEKRVDDLEKLREFNYQGYRYRPDLSSPELMSFTRKK
jgi:cytoplasmic iron level regulating protein YaaA (DUF328/UPF0246 family)